MQAAIREWGNSAAVRIPKTVMTEAALRVDQIVDIRFEDGRLIIEPVLSPSYELDDLLLQVTADNLPEHVDFGAPVGAEVW